MPAPLFIDWMAFYKVEHEYRTDTAPPVDYDDPEEHSAALDALLR